VEFGGAGGAGARLDPAEFAGARVQHPKSPAVQPRRMSRAASSAIYRFVAPVIGGVGITPYTAGQFTTFDLPAYAEQALAGANTFALAYGARDVTDSRSELGIRTDKSWARPDGIFTLRGRLAWAHDYDPDRSIGAAFQTLPGASFVVTAPRKPPTPRSSPPRWKRNGSTAGPPPRPSRGSSQT